MGNLTLIIGESGTGKSTSIRNLDEKETFIINVLDKPLPFRGYSKKYKKITKEGDGNCFSSDDSEKIIKIMRYVNNSMNHIKVLIIDDFQYILLNEYMKRTKEKGYDKYNEIARNAWLIFEECKICRSDLFIFILSHSEETTSGKIKFKTVGKLLDERLNVEAAVTTMFQSIVVEGKYKFLTQNNGIHTAKSPMEMFPEILIDNDLNYVKNVMIEYNEGENL